MRGIEVLVMLTFVTLVACLAQNSRAAAPRVFLSHYLERGDTDTIPRPNQIVDTISVFAAPGQYEPATLSVRAGDEDLLGVRVALKGDLRSEMGDTISAEALQIRLVEPFALWRNKQYQRVPEAGESDAHQYREMFLPLLKSPLDIQSESTRRLWLIVHVPPDARPGTYRGEIVVHHTSSRIGPDLGRSMTLGMVNYELAVLPIDLATAAETGMAFFMYNNTAYYPERLITPEYQQRVLDDMHEHGMTTATLYLYPQTENGRVNLSAPQERYLSFTQAMDLLHRADLPAPGLPVIWLGAENFKEDAWTAVLEERINRGWPEIIFYAVDEPEEEDRNVRVRAFMRSFDRFRRQNPQYKVRVTTAIGSSRGVQTVGHHYDLWIGCMAQETGESGLIADARMIRKELWTYDCMLAPVDAETDRYYFGIWAWVSGVKGCAHWAYYDGHPRLSYIYPDDDEIIPTIGWEAVRQGINDYRYLFTLKQLADEARAAGRVDLLEGADRLFEEVERMVTMDNYGLAYQRMMGSEAPAAGAYERPRVEPKLAIEAYDDLRLRVARRIEELQRARSGP